jgi:hypothetical protein
LLPMPPQRQTPAPGPARDDRFTYCGATNTLPQCRCESLHTGPDKLVTRSVALVAGSVAFPAVTCFAPRRPGKQMGVRGLPATRRSTFTYRCARVGGTVIVSRKRVWLLLWSCSAHRMHERYGTPQTASAPQTAD